MTSKEELQPQEIWVNQIKLLENDILKWNKEIAKCKASVNLQYAKKQAGDKVQDYWYDKKSGFWGWAGGPIQGIISPNLAFIEGSCEGNWTTKWNIDEYQPTNVWVNNREVHPLDLEHFQRLRLPIKPVDFEHHETAEFWSIDRYGEIVKEFYTEDGVPIPDTVDLTAVEVTIDKPTWVEYSKVNVEQKSTFGSFKDHVVHLKGDKTDGFFVYGVHIRCGANKIHTECKFSQFQDFYDYVKNRYSSLPQIDFVTNAFFQSTQNSEFIEKRRKELENYLTRVLQFPIVRKSYPALRILGINHCIESVPKAHLHKNSFERPLLALSVDERKIIADLFAYAAFNCPKKLVPLYAELIKQLDLPASIADTELALLKAESTQVPNGVIDIENHFKWDIIWLFISEAIKFGAMDSRYHITVQECAYRMGLEFKDLLELEGKCADFLQNKLTEIEDGNEKAKKLTTKGRKGKMILGGALGGSAMLIVGILATPLIIPVILSGTAILASTLPASLGISSAVLMSGSLLAMVMAPSLPLVFGAAGARLGTVKVDALTKGISEFGFVDIPDHLSEEQKKEEEIIKEETLPAFEIDWETKDVTLTEEGEQQEQNNQYDNELFEKLNKENESLDTKPKEIDNSNGDIKIDVNSDDNENSISSSEKEEFVESNIDENIENVDEIEIKPINNTGMRVCICIPGYLWKESELETTWIPVRKADPSAEVYSLKWETKELLHLGKCVVKTTTNILAKQAAIYWLSALSAFAAAAFAAIALPSTVLLFAGAIDNSWTVVHNRAKKAGIVLAETLLEKVQGNRPVTLIGLSHGAQVLFSCLEYLVSIRKEKEVTGIIENAIFLGAACTSDAQKWNSFKSVVAGRIINGYCAKDWVLGLIHRTAGYTVTPAGITSIESDIVENFDLTSIVPGHLFYKSELPKILDLIQIARSTVHTDWEYKVCKDIKEESTPETIENESSIKELESTEQNEIIN